VQARKPTSVQAGSRPKPVAAVSRASSGASIPANQPQQADDVRIPYDMVLISLSEEYIDAAHTLGPRVGLLGGRGDVETYNGLVAAGLGCLEACLKVRLLY
jgi:hypothetical protein